MENYEKNQIFNQQMNKVRKEQFVNMLKCSLCHGFYRFAHTLVQCGHTFCQLCIFNYIRGYKGKNPDVKCPNCHEPVQSNLKKSIIKDIYKQSLVDMLEPKFVQQQALIIKRVQTLFPQFNLEFLLEQFKYSTCKINAILVDAPKKSKKKQDQKLTLSRLPQKIRQNLGISFQKFTQTILDDKQYQNYLQIIKKRKQIEISKILQIKPKSQRDFNYVGIKNQMKIQNLNGLKLRRFLQRKVLERANNTGDFAKQWITPDSDKLDIRISLWIDNIQLEDTTNLDDIIMEGTGYVTYSIN